MDIKIRYFPFSSGIALVSAMQGEFGLPERAAGMEKVTIAGYVLFSQIFR